MSRMIIIAAALLSALAPVAQAETDYPKNERPDHGTVLFVPEAIAVSAGTILSQKELTRRDIKANTILDVPVFPSSGVVDRSSRND